MGTQFTLQKILNQISENKDKLKMPNPNSGGESNGPVEPIPEVKEFFSEEQLKKREEELKRREEQLKARESYEEAFKTDGEPEYPSHTPLESLPPEIKGALENEKEEHELRSVFDLKDLFLMFRDKFDDLQKAALDSIVKVCDTIEVGCNCKRGSRLKIAEDYYVKFITENQHNGLIDKIKETLNTKKIKFYSKDTIFLER